MKRGLVAVMVVGCGHSAPPPDGTALKVCSTSCVVGSRVEQDDGVTWFVTTPLDNGPSRLCQLRDDVLACVDIPGADADHAHADIAPSVHLIAPKQGAPLIAIDRGDGSASIVRASSWEHVVDAPTGPVEDGRLEADGSILYPTTFAIDAARPGEVPAKVAWQPDPYENHLLGDQLFWVTSATGDQHELHAAQVTAAGLGAVHDLGAIDGSIYDGCRAGDLIAIRINGAVGQQLATIDPERGILAISHVGGDRGELSCGQGGAASLEREIPESQVRGVWCDRARCASVRGGPPHLGAHLNYVTATVLGDRVLWAATDMDTNRVELARGGPDGFDPAVALRIAGGEAHQDLKLASLARGAIVVFMDGSLIVLDDQGRPRPITLAP